MLWSIDTVSSVALHEQIAGNVRRAVADGFLAPGERLPPAAELAATLDVNANTVLHAFRRLRDEGLLEFRRGRGVRVAVGATGTSQLIETARQLLELGRRQGYTPHELGRLLEDLR